MGIHRAPSTQRTASNGGCYLSTQNVAQNVALADTVACITWAIYFTFPSLTFPIGKAEIKQAPTSWGCGKSEMRSRGRKYHPG